MSQVYEHNPGDHEDPAPGMTWMMGIIGMLILIVIYFGITAVYRDSQTFDDAEKYQAEAEKPAEAVKRAAMEQINTKDWHPVDNAEGVRENRWTIPIDRAMDLMAEQLRRDQSAALTSNTEEPALAAND